MGASGHETGARYRGTEPPAAGPGGHEAETQHPASDRAYISRERRRLFTADASDLDTVADIFIGATEEIQPTEIGELTAVMNQQQLAASLQHMAPKWRELKGGDTGKTRTCRSSTSDSQLLQPVSGIYTGVTHTSPRRTQRRPTELPRDSGEDPPRNIDRNTAGPVRDIPMPTPTRRTKTPDEPAEEATGNYDKPRKPAANQLETYAGQGASVESFIAKFESHAKYYKWSTNTTEYSNSIPIPEQSNGDGSTSPMDQR